jgi:hypothetical protein
MRCRWNVSPVRDVEWNTPDIHLTLLRNPRDPRVVLIRAIRAIRVPNRSAPSALVLIRDIRVIRVPNLSVRSAPSASRIDP